MTGGKAKLTCEKCKKVFGCKRYLTKHMNRHETTRPSQSEGFSCGMCCKEFSRLSHLRRHQLAHLDVREWGCPFCDLRFLQKAHLLRHIGRLHESSAQQQLDALIEEKRHSLEAKASLSNAACPTPSTSDVGGKTTQKVGIPRSYVNRILCYACGKSFKSNFELDRHKKVHISVRCMRCRRPFEGIAALKTHELKCRDEKEVCSCGASFSRRADLRLHQNACKNKASFQCVPCKSFFSQRVQLDRHIKKMHYRDEKCEQCEEEMKSPVALSKHYMRAHGRSMCGYCDLEDPEEGHVERTHWIRFKQAVRLPRPSRTRNEKKNKKRGQAPQPSESAVESSSQQLQLPEQSIKAEPGDIPNFSFLEEELNQAGQSSGVCDGDAPIEDDCFEDAPLDVKGAWDPRDFEYGQQRVVEDPFGPMDDLDMNPDSLLADDLDMVPDQRVASLKQDVEEEDSEVCLKLVLSIPPGVASVSLAGRLPVELQQMFPMLAETKLMGLDLGGLQDSDLILYVDVPVPVRPNVDISKWLDGPIYLN